MALEVPEEAFDRARIEVASVRDASPRRPDDADTGDVVKAALEAAAPLIVAAAYAQLADEIEQQAWPMSVSRLRERASVLRGEGDRDG